MEKEVVLHVLRGMNVNECDGCGLERDCKTKGCRILREAVELIEGQGQALERALGQLRRQEDACESCKHSGTAVPCIDDTDPVMVCDTCTYVCPCKECRGYSSWEWNEGGTDAEEAR